MKIIVAIPGDTLPPATSGLMGLRTCMFQDRELAVQKAVCHKTSNTAGVNGVLLYEKHMLVIHFKKNSLYLYTISGLLQVTIPGILHPQHMVLLGEGTQRHLVVSDLDKKLHWVYLCVESGEFRLQTIDTKELTYRPVGMTVTSRGGILICAPYAHRVYMYSSTGQHEGHIQLSRYAVPGHVLECTRGSGYVISDLYWREVMWVNRDGSVLRTAKEKIRPFLHLYGPRDLIKDSEGHVLVTDYCGHQVLVFGQSGQCADQLLGKKDGMYRPGRLLLDQKNDKLYVACMMPTRVMIYTYSALLDVCRPMLK